MIDLAPEFPPKGGWKGGRENDKIRRLKTATIYQQRRELSGKEGPSKIKPGTQLYLI